MVRFLVATIVLLSASAAHASAVFTFNQSGGRPAGSVLAEGRLVLSDDAYARGLSIAANQASPASDWAGLGIEALSFTTNGRHVDLASLVPAGLPPSPLYWTLALRSGAGGTPTGTISFATGEWDVTYRLDGASSGGAFNSDEPGACFRSGTCSFSGSFAQVTRLAATVVPEPAGAAILGLALAGLALSRRGARPGMRLAARAVPRPRRAC